jgi:hypothetical protein
MIDGSEGYQLFTNHTVKTRRSSGGGEPKLTAFDTVVMPFRNAFSDPYEPLF